MTTDVVNENVLKLENIERIEYKDMKDGDLDSPFRLLDWDGKKWVKYSRNYSGTTWYECKSVGNIGKEKIRSMLDPVAHDLGVTIDNSFDIEKTNLEKLVEKVAEKVTNSNLPEINSLQKKKGSVYKIKNSENFIYLEPKYN